MGQKYRTAVLVRSWGCLGRDTERGLQIVRVLFRFMYHVVVGTWKCTLLLIFNCTSMCISQNKTENIINKMFIGIAAVLVL